VFYCFVREFHCDLSVMAPCIALPPAWPRPASRPVPGLTFSLQSCVSAVKTVFMGGHYLRFIPFFEVP
jgi:hypothetical protein